MNERGYSREKVMTEIENRANDSAKYINPQKDYADIVISYLSKEEFPIGDSQYIPKYEIKIILNSGVNLEKLLYCLGEHGIKIDHDYSEDVNTQIIRLEQPPERDLMNLYSGQIITNIEEIAGKLYWQEGFRGFVQLFILLVVSEKLKNKINA